MKKYSILIILGATMLLSCKNGKSNFLGEKEGEEVVVETIAFDNPLDSIIYFANNISCYYDEVYKYLLYHPNFVNKSKNVGYYTNGGADKDPHLLWKDCESFRVYSIPDNLHWALTCRNIVQYKEKGGTIDTLLLEENNQCMEELCEIKGEDGTRHYLLRTSLLVWHQGITYWEKISAFSLKNGRLVEEKLFHTKKGQYDKIAVQCGGQRDCPLDFDRLVLIALLDFDDSEEAPAVVITNVNENDWPSGYGLKYKWNGHHFEYTGQCNYDADGIYRIY